MPDDLNVLSDSQLIQRYVGDGDKPAFESLLKRYYQITFQRFIKHCRDPDLAADLTQQLWTQMVKSLGNYRDDGKFPNFLMRSVTNLLFDHWRRKGVKDKVIQESYRDDEDDFVALAPDPSAGTESRVELQEQIDHLTGDLIPALPCEQRLAFLLKHESEYWEDKQRLSWQHLAQLNGLDESTAWQLFEDTRNALLRADNKGKNHPDTACEAVLIFLVWTQAQRISKKQDFTWSYFSKILNVPENTLKTRYRTALKTLADGLKELNEHE